MSSFSNVESGSKKSTNAYDSTAMGEAFARDIAAAGSMSQASSVDATIGGEPRVGDNSEALLRFGDNAAVKAAFPEISQGSGTEKGARSVGSNSVEGIYVKSKVPAASARGRKTLDADADLFPFNYVAGRRSEYIFAIGKDDRLSPRQAKTKLSSIFAMYGLEAESHEFLYSFTHALLVAHAVNGASMIGPGRAEFFVDGERYSYGDIIKMLGPDARRFFRAYADETAKALLMVLERYDPGDSDSVRICGQIRFIAVNKKLTQFPYLIHDSADACCRISVTEMAAVSKSKAHVLGAGTGSSAIDDLERSIDA